MRAAWGGLHGVFWEPGDARVRGEAFLTTTERTTLTLTSGTADYPGFAIAGADKGAVRRLCGRWQGLWGLN